MERYSRLVWAHPEGIIEISRGLSADTPGRHSHKAIRPRQGSQIHASSCPQQSNSLVFVLKKMIMQTEVDASLGLSQKHLRPLPGSGTADICSGGVAALNPRLTSTIPPGSKPLDILEIKSFTALPEGAKVFARHVCVRLSYLRLKTPLPRWGRLESRR